MIGKFKVWDSKKKYMLSKDWDFFIHQDGKLFFLSKKGINKADPWFIPIFSTGKTDKNGVELFDGDIVSFDELGCHNPRSGQIIEIEIPLFYRMTSGMRNIEKIGNKFENPELKEAKT